MPEPAHTVYGMRGYFSEISTQGVYMTLRSKSQLNGSIYKGIPRTEKPQRDKPNTNIPERKSLTGTDKLNIWKKNKRRCL